MLHEENMGCRKKIIHFKVMRIIQTNPLCTQPTRMVDYAERSKRTSGLPPLYIVYIHKMFLF